MPPQDRTYVRDCVMYLRKSKGKAGIARQRKENRAYAERIGWRIVAEFVEPDTTAFAKIGEEDAPRPEYGKMIDFLSRDSRTPALGILSWHVDRLSRNSGEVRPFITVCVKGDHLVETPRCGGYNLSLPNNRKRFRDDVSDAEGEVDHMIERIDAAKAEAAAEGRWLGGRRRFGFADATAHDPGEAKAIVDGCVAALAGSSAASIARDWNARGLFTPRLKNGGGGNPWDANGVRRVLTAPRIAGLMVWRGEVVGKASWEPIVPEATWRAVTRVLTDPGRRTSPGPERKWLGSGLYVCGVCDKPRLLSRAAGSTSGDKQVAVYRCGPKGEHVSRNAVLLDRYVEEHIVARLSRDDARSLLLDEERPDLEELEQQLLALREDLDQWREAAKLGPGRGGVTLVAFKPVERERLAEIAEIEAKMIVPERAAILRDLVEADDVAAAWEDTSVDRKRTVLRCLFTVTVRQGPKGRPKGHRPGESYFDTGSIDVRPV